MRTKEEKRGGEGGRVENPTPRGTKVLVGGPPDFPRNSPPFVSPRVVPRGINGQEPTGRARGPGGGTFSRGRGKQTRSPQKKNRTRGGGRRRGIFELAFLPVRLNNGRGEISPHRILGFAWEKRKGYLGGGGPGIFLWGEGKRAAPFIDGGGRGMPPGGRGPIVLRF